MQDEKQKLIEKIRKLEQDYKNYDKKFQEIKSELEKLSANTNKQ